jgi:ATP-dependent Clp protease protease subunit
VEKSCAAGSSCGSDSDLLETLDENFAKHRRIYLRGEVNEEMSEQFTDLVQYYLDTNSDPIFLYISSHGGSVDEMENIIDWMEIAKEALSIYTIGIKAYSAAADILSAGTKGHRYVLPNSNVMLHPCSYSLDSDYQEFQERIQKFIKLKNAATLKRFADYIGKDAKKLDKEMKHSIWLIGEEAVNFGVVDGVWNNSHECLIRQLAKNRQNKEQEEAQEITREKTEDGSPIRESS